MAIKYALRWVLAKDLSLVTQAVFPSDAHSCNASTRNVHFWKACASTVNQRSTMMFILFLSFRLFLYLISLFVQPFNLLSHFSPVHRRITLPSSLRGCFRGTKHPLNFSPTSYSSPPLVLNLKSFIWFKDVLGIESPSYSVLEIICSHFGWNKRECKL